MRIFECVYSFPEGATDFVLEGVFTNRADAVAFAQEICPGFLDNSKSFSEFRMVICGQSRHAIIEGLVKVRLGELGKQMEEFSQLLKQYYEIVKERENKVENTGN